MTRWYPIRGKQLARNMKCRVDSQSFIFGQKRAEKLGRNEGYSEAYSEAYDHYWFFIFNSQYSWSGVMQHRHGSAYECLVSVRQIPWKTGSHLAGTRGQQDSTGLFWIHGVCRLFSLSLFAYSFGSFFGFFVFLLSLCQSHVQQL